MEAFLLILRQLPMTKKLIKLYAMAKTTFNSLLWYTCFEIGNILILNQYQLHAFATT
jgi:hypothetical protein